MPLKVIRPTDYHEGKVHQYDLVSTFLSVRGDNTSSVVFREGLLQQELMDISLPVLPAWKGHSYQYLASMPVGRALKWRAQTSSSPLLVGQLRAPAATRHLSSCTVSVQRYAKG